MSVNFLLIQNERKRVVLLDILDKFEAVRNSEKFGCQAKGELYDL